MLGINILNQQFLQLLPSSSVTTFSRCLSALLSVFKLFIPILTVLAVSVSSKELAVLVSVGALHGLNNY